MQKFFACLLMLANIASSAFAGWKVTKPPARLVGGEGKYFMNPRWSPDGAQIAFTELRYQGLWVMNADGTDMRQLTDEAAAGFGFEWSPDARVLLSRVAKYEGPKRYNAVKLFDLGANENRLLTDYRTLMPGLPHWAAGGAKVYLFNQGQLEIFDSGLNGSALEKTAASEQIHFLKDGQIAIGSLASSEHKTFAPVAEHEYLNLTISPDRQKIAFEVKGGNLHVMNVDGTGLVDLGPGNRPQWSPEGDYLVYMIAGDDGHNFLASDIYLIKIDGSEKTQLTATDEVMEMNPSWAADNKIAFDTMDEGAIYVLQIGR